MTRKLYKKGDPLLADDLNRGGKLRKAIRDEITDAIKGDGRFINTRKSDAGVSLSFVGRIPGVQAGATFARITGHTAIGGANYRWLYDITLVQITPTFSGSTLSDITVADVSPAVTSKAVNLAEWTHTSTIAFGVDNSLTDYPAGFDARPVGAAGDDDTHDTDEIVEVVKMTDASGNVGYWFSKHWTHDGGCSA